MGKNYTAMFTRRLSRASCKKICYDEYVCNYKVAYLMVFIRCKNQMVIYMLSLVLISRLPLFILLQKVRAERWIDIDAFTNDLQQNIAASNKFDDSLINVEYTAVHIKRYRKELYAMHNFCLQVLGFNNSTEVLTVIEVKMSTASEQSNNELLADIIKCILGCTGDNNKKESFTNDAYVRINTVLRRDLKDFLLMSDELNSMRHIQDIIHEETRNEINCIIDICLNDILSNSIFRKTAEYVFTYCARSIEELSDDDYSKIIRLIANDLTTSKYAKDYYDIKNLKAIFGNAEPNETALQRIKRFQKANDIKFYKDSEVLKEMALRFRNHLENTLLYHLQIAVQNLSKMLVDQKVDAFETIFSWFVSLQIAHCTEHNQTNSSLDIDHAYELFVAKYKKWVRFYNCNLELQDKIGFRTFANESRKVNFSDALLAIKPAYYCESFKIICNEKITKENIHLLCHIINNIEGPIWSGNNQIIYINMRHCIDLEIVSERIQKTHSYNDKKHVLKIAKNIIAKKFTLMTKRQGELFYQTMSVDLCSINIAAKSYEIQDNAKLKDKMLSYLAKKSVQNTIRNTNKVFCKHKILTANHQSIMCKKNNSNNHVIQSTVKISIMGDKSSYSIVILIYRDNKDFGIAYAKYDSMSIAPLGDNTAQEDYELNFTRYNGVLSKKILLDLSHYLHFIMHMPNSLEIPDLLYTQPSSYYAKEFSLTIPHVNEDTLDLQIGSRIAKLQDALNLYFKNNANTIRIATLEVNLLDVLKRKSRYGLWMKATKKFLDRIGINKEDFDGILEDFLIDKNQVNATNDYDMVNVNTNAFKIRIYAVTRKNTNTLIYIVRQDLENDLKTSPLSFAWKLYNKLLDEDINSETITSNICLRATNCLLYNPITYIIKTMLNLKFSMLGDVRKQFESNKNEFYKIFYAQINLHLANKINAKNDPNFYEKHKMILFNMCLKPVLKNEVYNTISKIEKIQNAVLLKKAIKITALPLKCPNESDLQDMDMMDSILKDLQ